MGKKCVKKPPQLQMECQIINLNNLPPLDPSTLFSQTQVEKTKTIAECVVKKFDDEANTEADFLVDKKSMRKIIDVDDAWEANRRVSAKSELHEICAANKWKPPLFECCKEEGPSHKRFFTYMVKVEIEGEHSVALECFGAPRTNKKAAAEHAAEGALWYLKNFGYFPINKLWKRKKK